MKAIKFFLAGCVAVFVTVNLLAYWQALTLVSHPLDARAIPDLTPVDRDLNYQDVQVTSSDGIELHGWFVPGNNDALIIMQHGYKWHRAGFLDEAEMFHRTGFNLLITSVRAHDMNAGDRITFGVEEMKDLDAWVNYARALPGINTEHIGMLGDSLGGSMVIQYAADHSAIKAVVAHSAFSSMQDTIETSIRHYTGLPPFPFAPLIQFWAERILGISIDVIDAKQWIGKLSPRPVFIIHSVDDEVISGQSGQMLFDAAREPRRLWLESNVGHADFDKVFPQQFEEKVAAFFNEVFYSSP